jgi:hypothetical protein
VDRTGTNWLPTASISTDRDDRPYDQTDGEPMILSKSTRNRMLATLIAGTFLTATAIATAAVAHAPAASAASASAAPTAQKAALQRGDLPLPHAGLVHQHGRSLTDKLIGGAAGAAR